MYIYTYMHTYLENINTVHYYPIRWCQISDKMSWIFIFTSHLFYHPTLWLQALPNLLSTCGTYFHNDFRLYGSSVFRINLNINVLTCLCLCGDMFFVWRFILMAYDSGLVRIYVRFSLRGHVVVCYKNGIITIEYLNKFHAKWLTITRFFYSYTKIKLRPASCMSQKHIITIDEPIFNNNIIISR